MRSRALALFLSLLCFSLTMAMAEDPLRRSELARIEKESQAQKNEAEEKVADLLPQQKSLRDKVAQKEKILRDLTRRRRITGPTTQALQKLRAELERLDARIEDRQRPHLQMQDDLEQERRRVMKRFREPGDPAYLEVGDKLYTKEEWVLAKTMSPRGVAEEYLQELLRRGFIRSAKYTDTTRHAVSMDRAADGSPVHDFVNVNYTVQYVSKGGVLNERNAWVTVITIDGKHWMVSQMMKDFEVLGGLP